LELQIERAARRNDNFRKALRCAWVDGSVTSAIAERLRPFGDLY